MSWLLAAFSALFLAGEKYKEAKRPVIPASYWRNKELMNADKLNPNISPEQVMKNLESGKYYLPEEPKEEIPDYSFREGENINAWFERLSRERNEMYDKMFGRK